MREIVESIVVAFVLAFLFRTFEAEAFVIPTGSMAPTLMGRHKDVVCAKCGYRYQVSASEEMKNAANEPSGESIVAATCPMCRYTMYIGGNNPQDKYYPSYKGDRILVAKFPFQFREPKRWEVTVFRFPGGANTNYIKRLVGLPNETIKISHGDIFTRPLGQREFHIQRKPSSKLLAMLRPVYNNDYVLPELVKIGWPTRWYAWPQQNAGRPGQWISDDLKQYRTDGSAPGEAWLRYRHVVPSYDDWKWLARGSMPPSHPHPQPQLVTDFVGYNTQIAAPTSHASMGSLWRGFDPDPRSLGLHWVGDLAVRANLNVLGNSGEIILELVRGGVRFQCRLDVAAGTALLGIEGHPEFGRPKAKTAVHGPGSHKVMFANVDRQLRLWVDGAEIQFDAPTTYDPLDNEFPTAEDREPVRIGSAQAAAEVRHLEVLRDIYYIAVDTRGALGSYGSAMSDYDQSPFAGKSSAEEVAEVLSDPSQWGGFRSARSVQFDLGKDQFLMLGDNSAESRDSRLWPADGIEYYVRRDLLIGKALVIYWPHGWDIPGTDLPVKVIPNFGRMMRPVR
jgi:signal peptidase I